MASKAEEEKQRIAKIRAMQKRIADGRYQSGYTEPTVGNEKFGGDPLDPNSYVPFKYTSPELSQPIPDSQPYNPNFPTGASMMRAAQIEEFVQNPQGYIKENTTEMNQEQSLVDKGLSILGQLVDYQDDSDLQMFGVNLSAVESTFDMALQTIIGVEDTKNALLTAAVSALPGGVQTMDWGQVTNNQGFGDIIQGRLEEGSTPTVGQTAIASIAIEAKRIRDGDARLSDIMLLNPATAPFIAAALAAENSPLQADDWQESDLFDKEKREEDFSQGWENSMSRIFDAGVLLADPLVGLGVVSKVARVGMLGRPGTAAFSRNFDKAVPATLEELKRLDELAGNVTNAGESIGQARIDAFSRRGQTVADEIDDAAVNPDFAATRNDVADTISPEQYNETLVFDSDAMDPALVKQYKENDNILVRQIFEMFEVKARTKGSDVKTRVSAIELAKSKSIESNPMAVQFAQLMLQAKSPQEAILYLRGMNGSKGALEEIRRVSAGKADTINHYRNAYYKKMFGNGQPQKVAMVRASLRQQINTIRSQQDNAKAAVRKIEEKNTKGVESTATEASDPISAQRKASDPNVEAPDSLPIDNLGLTMQESGSLARQKNILQELDKELGKLESDLAQVVDGVDPDVLDPLSRSYDPVEADRIVEDLLHDAYNSANPVPRETIKELEDLKQLRNDGDIFFDNLEDTFVQMDSNLLVKNNWYSKRVAASRSRRARAAFQYSQEGTNILPRRVLVASDKAAGAAVVSTDLVKKTEFWSPSTFKGTNSVQRNLRAWRWLGEKTPAGYLSLTAKGINGLEDEFNAALDTSLYKGGPVRVTRQQTDANGKLRFERNKQGQEVPLMEDIFVGGQERKVELQQRLAAAVMDPTQDAPLVFLKIQDEIYDDMAKAYGITKSGMDAIKARAYSKASTAMDQVNEKAYFVDPTPNGGAPDVQIVAFLESTFKNGTYMHNFRELEKILKKETKNGGASSLNSLIDAGLELTSSGYNLFNNFWRPLTLFRMSYTQRNVLEGVFRAMAFNSSLAPLLWPVAATSMGVRNIRVTAKVNKASKKANKAIRENPKGKEYAEISVQLNRDQAELNFLENAGRTNLAQDTYVIPQSGNSPAKSIPMSEYENRVAELKQSIADNNALLELNVPDYDAAVKGTKFGTWRDNNIKDLEKTLIENDKQRTLLNQQQIELINLGQETSTAKQTILQELADADVIINQRLRDLRTNINEGTRMYREIAGRKIRIGSGQSIGPDGNYYNDSFAGPYDQINRGNLSADATIMQNLSLATGTDNVFRNIQRRHNVAIQATAGRKGTVKNGTYAKGISEALESSSSSIFVQALWRNNFDIDLTLNDLATDPSYSRALVLAMSMMEDGDDLARLSKIADAYLADFKPGTALGDEFVTAFEGIKASPFATTGVNTAQEVIDAIDPASGQIKIKSKGQIKRFLKRDAQTNTVEIFDNDTAAAYLRDVLATVNAQMQNNPEFLSVLGKRIEAKTRKTGEAPLSPKPRSQSRKKVGAEIAPESGDSVETIQQILDNMSPEDIENLGWIVGDELVDIGVHNVMRWYAGFVKNMFTFLSTIPEDAVVRAPFYNSRYKASRNAMLEAYLRRTGQMSESPRKTKTKAGAEIEGTIEHGKIKIPVKEMARIEAQSHALALRDTKKWMYTIERRTKLGKYGEWIIPFISATQNSATVGGKLLYRDPALAPAIYNIWRMPGTLGIEDDDGNIILPQPPSVIKRYLKDHPEIPIFGGVFGEDDVMTIPKNAFNLFAPESGYGLVPRPGPLAGIAASEVMKTEMFGIGVERPDILASAMGEEAATQVWSEMKKYIYGEYGGVSKENLSWDKVVPAAWSKVWASRTEMSNQYAKYYANHEASQRMRYYYGDRDDIATTDEINKRATNSLLFEAVGNFGAPNPLAPYPHLSRPQVNTPLQEMQNWYRQQMEIDPENASANLEVLFGDWALNGVNQKVTKNVGGADPVATTVSDINTLEPLIRQISPYIDGANLGVLGILVNNRTPPEMYDEDFEKSAYEILKEKTIAGRDETWRSTQTGEMALADRQKSKGWKKFTQYSDQLDARVAAAGLSSLQVKAAEPFRQERKQFIENMKSDPELRGWTASYTAGARGRIGEAIKVMEAGLKDSGFAKLMMDSGKERTYGIMGEYIQGRNAIMEVLQESGHSIDHASNAHWKNVWESARLRWRNSDQRWSEIDLNYLSGDNNPEFFGTNFTDGDM